MSKDDNVYVKLELNKNKNSGKIDIVARFNNKAPNITVENNEYFWMPTIEEKNFLNEAFNLFPNSSVKKSSHSAFDSKDSIPMKKETSEEEPKLEKKESMDIKEPVKKEIYSETKTEDIEKEKPIEKKEPSVFKVTEENKEIKDEPDQSKSLDRKESDTDLPKEETGDEKTKNEDDALIVKADSQAIENALEKHKKKNDDDDDTIVEADEKTIIDRVLKQKKKGKWKK